MASKALEIAGALGHVHADKRVEILRRVGEAGSISQAARDAGVSYKAAWQALDTLSNLAGSPLVERAVGGAGGGGARLTAAGQHLLLAADELTRARDQALERVAAPGRAATAFAALGLRTSMRNQFPCVVRALRKAAGVVLVELELPGGALLASRITYESMQLLGLQKGQDVLALCKATAVEVSARATPGDARNQLHGRVTRVTNGVTHGVTRRVTRVSGAAAGGEAALALDGGLQLVGFAAAGSGLKIHADAMAYVDASAVVIAVSG